MSFFVKLLNYGIGNWIIILINAIEITREQELII
jgi:hypothetical protein